MDNLVLHANLCEFTGKNVCYYFFKEQNLLKENKEHNNKKREMGKLFTERFLAMVGEQAFSYTLKSSTVFFFWSK